ncbi:MAG: cation-transporting P-type ATPase [Acidobacteria bacterium]|nr:cation-transporting P-type ATPase [Acidobacteriota bacterium]MCW5971007.1 cation-transporting P-type ATPase [Blastocatellales bacterium]
MTSPPGSNTGLTAAEARARLAEYGPNSLSERPPPALWRRVLRQFQSALIYILLFALAADLVIWIIEGASGIPVESIAIAFILALNAGLGVYQESKAEAALSRLKALAAAQVWTLRDGELVHLPATELVPGDVVRIEAGDRIPADGSMLEGQGVMVDESILTGESVPIDKEIGEEFLSGALAVRGKAYFEVTRTGAASAMGRLAVMIGDIETEKTPLERRLETFGHQIAVAVVILAAFIAVGGILIEGIGRFGHVLLFAVALAVAAVPEGLPAVLTLTLALGVERMARRKAVVRRLSAVEALGSVTVIATDKTGTLTENRMFVKDVDAPDAARARRAMVLANDAETETGAGDPLELALLDDARTHGCDPAEMHRMYPRIGSLPFDSAHKFMRATVNEQGRTVSYLKGAPEVIIERSRIDDAQRRNWEEKATAYATEGFRVIALGACEGEADEDLDFLGLVLLWDPPRPEVPEAIRRAQQAGIRVVMVTGDHPATALAIAREVGIQTTRVVTGLELETLSPAALGDAVSGSNVFARVAPEHKLRLVDALKKRGEVVAMTGDGVNDAPALKRSDVGVAMGERGSDVTREVADLVLLDDNFATIVAAIEEGRGIYENIQKFIRFLFSTNFALVLLVVGGAFGSYMMGLQDAGGGLLLPLTAVQLLWINIIADGPPALALGLDRNPDVMEQRPRDPKSPLLDRASLQFIVVTGVVKAMMGGVLLVLLPLYGYGVIAARSAVFLFESIAQLVFAYPSRSVSVRPEPNLWLHVAVLLGTGLQILTIFAPSLRLLLGLEPLDAAALAWMAGGVFLSWLAAEIISRISWARTHRNEPSR